MLGHAPPKTQRRRLVLAAAIIHDVTAYSAGIQRFCPRHRSRQPVVATPMMLAKQEEVEAKDKESKKPYKKAKAVKHEKKQAVPEPAASADELIASAAKQPEPVTESTSSDGVDLPDLAAEKASLEEQLDDAYDASAWARLQEIEKQLDAASPPAKVSESAKGKAPPPAKTQEEEMTKKKTVSAASTSEEVAKSKFAAAVTKAEAEEAQAAKQEAEEKVAAAEIAAAQAAKEAAAAKAEAESIRAAAAKDVAAAKAEAAQLAEKAVAKAVKEAEEAAERKAEQIIAQAVARAEAARQQPRRRKPTRRQ